MNAAVTFHPAEGPTGPKPHDTLHWSVVPIVFIPGVMGTRLNIPGGLDWDPDNPVTMTGWLLANPRTGHKDLSVTFKHGVTVIDELSDHRILGQNAQAAIMDDKELVEGVAIRVFGKESRGDIIALYKARGWGGLTWEFYGPILRYLEKQLNSNERWATGLHPVYAYGYDWRQSNALSAAGLVRRVDEILAEWPQAKRVLIVTHSMGGLVARYACARLDLSSKVLGVVHTVQPSNGAVVAYRRFFTGCTNELDNGGNIPMNIILGDRWWKYLAHLSGLPGPMQLLPNQRYSQQEELPFQLSPFQWLVTSPQVELTEIYDVYDRPVPPGIVRGYEELSKDWLTVFKPGARTWDEEILPELKKRISEARTFHQELGNGSHPDTYVIFTSGLRTDERVDWTKPEGRGRYQQGDTGDGTVPSASGACPGLSGVQERRMFNEGPHLAHSDIFHDEDINGQVRDYLYKLLASQAP